MFWSKNISSLPVLLRKSGDIWSCMWSSFCLRNTKLPVPFCVKAGAVACLTSHCSGTGGKLGLVRWFQSTLEVSAPQNSLETRQQTPNKQRHSDRVSISLSAREASLRPPYRANQSPGSGIGHDTHPIGAKCGVSCLRAGLRCRLRRKHWCAPSVWTARTEARRQQMSHGGDYK